MEHGERNYLRLLKTVLETGVLIPNRTGIAAYTVPHMMLQHNMELGFPLLTTKKMAWKSIKVELEGFLKAITDKTWYQERGCHIWDEWCNPKLIPPGLSPEEKKAFQLKETKMGPIYGYNWRNFNGQDYDQVKIIVDTLKTNPNDRRMVCSAWNPLHLQEQALPPCHVLWSLTVTNDKLNLCWFQRSCDFLLGVPFNIASYGLLLHLLCKESGFKEGLLTGFFANCHIYENHVKAVELQLGREPLPLPKIETPEFTSIFDWNHKQTSLVGYQSHDRIAAEIAV